MTVKVTMEDELIQPLIQRHLDEGVSVGKQVADAVAFYTRAMSEVAKDRKVISCVLRNGYANEQVQLLPKPVGSQPNGEYTHA